MVGEFFVRKFMLFLVVLLVLLPAVFAQTGHIKLLAVKEDSNGGNNGSVADLYLELQEGKGRVFIETFPLAKLDTQISTRFAKEIACNYLDKDCSNYDFIYTIRAGSTIVGGPSAGAAIAALTAAMLNEDEINQSVAITGTINSGDFVGPVGGLKGKIIAAANDDGLKKVLIPIGTRFLNEDNNTIDLVEYGKELGIDVKEVSIIGEVLEEFTGKEQVTIKENLDISGEYNGTMETLAMLLCNRSVMLKDKFENMNVDFVNQSEEIIDTLNAAINLTQQGKDAFNEKRYYSAASFCYGTNVKYRFLALFLNNWTNDVIDNRINAVRELADEFDAKSNREIKTITDLQTYMVVKERIHEAFDSLNIAEETNDTKSKVFYLSNAFERLYSANSWSYFFNTKGKEFKFNREVLQDSCSAKIAEAEERFHYVSLYFPGLMGGTKETLRSALDEQNNGNFELCLYKASKAKAESNRVLDLIGVEQGKVKGIVENKLRIVKDNIIRQAEKGMFPIVGYSYYEYADTLKETDTVSALLYLEYSLELSNLDLYFKKKNNNITGKIVEKKLDIKISLRQMIIILVLVVGFCIGVVFGGLVVHILHIVFGRKYRYSKKRFFRK